MNKNIFFCDKRIYLADHLVDDITKNLNHFPLITQEKINISNLKELDMSNPQLLTISMSDTKYILFLTTINNRQYCFFINQEKKHYFYCKFRFDVELFSGTIFIGEFFKNDKDSWSFYIEDLHYYEGKTQENVPFSERLELIYNTLKSRYTWDELMNICHLEIKPYFMYYYLEKIKDYTFLDNLYFVPESFFDPIKVINLDVIIKIDKIEEDKGVKMLIFTNGGQPDIYNLTDNHGNDYGIASVKTIEQSKFLRNYLRNNNEYRAKCKYNPIFKKWTLLK